MLYTPAWKVVVKSSWVPAIGNLNTWVRLSTHRWCYKTDTPMLARRGCRNSVEGNPLPSLILSDGLVKSCGIFWWLPFRFRTPAPVPTISAASFQRSIKSVTFLPTIPRPEMAAPISWAPGIFRSFCRKTSIPTRFLVLGAGFFFGGRGCKCQFYLMGMGILWSLTIQIGICSSRQCSGGIFLCLS